MFTGDIGGGSDGREEGVVVTLSTVLDEIIVSELDDDPHVNLTSWTWIPRCKIGLGCYLEIMRNLGEVLFYKFSMKLLIFLLIQIMQRRTVNLVEVGDEFGTILVRPGVSAYSTWRSFYVLVYMAGIMYSLLVYTKEQHVCRFLLVQIGSAPARNSSYDRFSWSEISRVWCTVVGILSRFCEIVDVIMFSYLSSQHLQPLQTVLFCLVRLSFATIQVRSFLAAGNVSSGFTEETQEPAESRDSEQALAAWSPDQPLPPSSSSFCSALSQEKEDDSRRTPHVEAENQDSQVTSNIGYRDINPIPPQSLSPSQFVTLSRDYQDTFTLCKLSQTFFSQGLSYYLHPEFSSFGLKGSFSPQDQQTRVRVKPFKILQLADLAFYLDLFSLENLLDSFYIVNRHKETHEFNISTYYIWKVLSHDLIMDICKLFFLVFVSRLSRGYLMLTLAISCLNISSLFFYLHVNKQVINDVLR